MGKKLPRFLIQIIFKWYESNKVVIRWKSSVSHIVQLTHGMRQGSVLSPYFFAIAVDEMLIGLNSFGGGCQYKHLPVAALMYADNIILISASDFCT